MEININVHEFFGEKMSEGGDIGDLKVLTFDDFDGCFDKYIVMTIEGIKYSVPTKELARAVMAFTVYKGNYNT